MQKTIKNRTIFCRDNLEILKGINTGTIDLIYLDPPFNKNKDFTAPIGSTAEGASFKDIFGTEDIKDEWVGLIADEYPVLHNYLTGIKGVGHKSNKYYLCYMAVRLIECHRVLKDTGSLYYHCDQTMSHYIKIMMDCIFGEKFFRNEVVWNYRTFSQAATKRPHFELCYDTIFCYVKNIKTKYTPIYFKQKIPISAMKKHGFNFDEKGYYKTAPTGYKKGGYSEQTIKSMDQEGLIYWTKNKIPRKKYYCKNDNQFIYDQKMLGNCWTDIPDMMHKPNEKLGYPAQKPVALLERILQASSNESDIVLDPFCGCATTCVAAEKLKRQWIGIDVSKKAFDLVRLRLGKEIEGHDTLFYESKIDFRTDMPQRTDTDYKPEKLNDKHYLFGLQEGICKGCTTRLDFRHFHIDHIYPQSKGGGDNIENLQLLCGSCNTIKGDRDMAYLMARLRELNII